MLSSIHPLGERSRQNRWILTVSAFTIGSVLAAVAVAAGLGWIGSLTLSSISSGTATLLLGGAFVLAAGLDALRIQPPGPERQVNESWIGAFRGWIYGGAFGAQLGSGVTTFVVTWTVYATFLSYLLLGSVGEAAVVGSTFGFGRSISVLAAGYIDRPTRLTSFNRKLAELGPRVRHGTVITVAAIGVVGMAAAVL